MIDARGIVVERMGRPIVSDVNFRAAAGGITAILGANGAGKSTLLRVLCGDCRPDRGSVRYFGRPLADWRPVELARRRAVVPQSSALNFPFTVAEVVLQGRAPHLERGAPGVDESAAAAALDAVDLARAASRDYTTLSGGERQRVHLARALAQVGLDGGGRCLLLDEPTSSLDLRHQHDVLRVLRRFADSGGCAVVVLHDLNLCMRYADKVVLMHYGRVLGSGDANAILTPDWLGIAYGLRVRRIEAGRDVLFSAG
ncbi:MAG: heme ABC transporter ATP-binding protein [Terrimicrobiaceae bacterium]|nr:heme ABC transporter ATP-binding protein [Terrimicrobiaceae bacterium]